MKRRFCRSRQWADGICDFSDDPSWFGIKKPLVGEWLLHGAFDKLDAMKDHGDSGRMMYIRRTRP